MTRTNLLLFFSLFILSINHLAGNIRAGNMQVEQLSSNTVSVTVNIYSDLHASPPQLELCWGDGNCEQWATLLLTEHPALDTRHHQMQTFHAYDQAKVYELTVVACCWAQDLKNITSANDKPFTLRTQFAFSGDDPILRNSMPAMESPIAICPLDGCGYIPEVSDLEGDSLDWQLCLPDLEGYSALDEVAPGPLNMVIFDQKTGRLSWGSPPFEGLYSYTTCVKEFRNDVLLSESESYTLVVVNNSLPTQDLELPEFVLAPNPATDAVSLRGLTPAWARATCRVYDLNGRLVFQQRGKAPLQVAHWKAGIYFLVLEKEGQMVRRRLVIF